MKTIEFKCDRDLIHYCKEHGDHSGVYVPLADYERLRRALEDVRREIEAAVNCGVLNQTGHNWMNYIDAIARKALEEERP
jgi:hypothetical protein